MELILMPVNVPYRKRCIAVRALVILLLVMRELRVLLQTAHCSKCLSTSQALTSVTRLRRAFVMPIATTRLPQAYRGQPRRRL